MQPDPDFSYVANLESGYTFILSVSAIFMRSVILFYQFRTSVCLSIRCHHHFNTRSDFG